MVKISGSNIQKVNSQAEVQNELIPNIYHLVLTNTMKQIYDMLTLQNLLGYIVSRQYIKSTFYFT